MMAGEQGRPGQPLTDVRLSIVASVPLLANAGNSTGIPVPQRLGYVSDRLDYLLGGFNLFDYTPTTSGRYAYIGDMPPVTSYPVPKNGYLPID